MKRLASLGRRIHLFVPYIWIPSEFVSRDARGEREKFLIFSISFARGHYDDALENSWLDWATKEKVSGLHSANEDGTATEEKGTFHNPEIAHSIEIKMIKGSFESQ